MPIDSPRRSTAQNPSAAAAITPGPPPVNRWQPARAIQLPTSIAARLTGGARSGSWDPMTPMIGRSSGRPALPNAPPPRPVARHTRPRVDAGASEHDTPPAAYGEP